MDALRSVIATDPGNAYALCLLAQALSHLDDFEGALWAATAAIALRPASAWAQRLASVAHRSLEHPAAAVAHARESVRLAPHLADSYRVLSQALAASGDLDGAAKAAERGLELRPSDPASHRAVGHVAFERKEFDRAEAAFRHALSIRPDDAVAHHEIARVALMRSHVRPASLADSVDGFARALAADPRQSVSRQNLSLALKIFLARGAYFLFIAAWLTVFARARDVTLGRVLGIVLLIAPAAFVTRFMTRLSPRLRAVLVDTVRTDTVLAVAVATEVVSVLAAVGGALTGSPALATTAVIGALAARVLVHSQLEGLLPGQHQIRTSILWCTAGSLGLMSAISFAVAATSGESPPVGAAAIGAIFALLGVGVAAVILSRRAVE